MEDIYIELLGNTPGATSIWISRYTCIHHTGSGQGERSIDDVGVAGNPANIGHTPVDIFGVNILNVFGCSSNIGQVAGTPMLAALGPAGGPAGIHQKQRGF